MGNSFWASALVGDSSRRRIAKAYPRLGLDRCNVALGFAGVDAGSGGAPSREIIDELIDKEEFDEEVIWRAVVLRSLRELVRVGLPDVWRGREGIVAWANEDAERLQKTLREADQRLVSSRRSLIVVFDALDRLGRNWRDVGVRTRALLRVALAMRSYRATKLKIFMRVDQADDQSVTGFPDASKLMGAKVDLVWERGDLYGLLFSILLKSDKAGDPFKKIVRKQTSISLDNLAEATLPSQLLEAQKQEAIFSELAGRYMGSTEDAAALTPGFTITSLMHLAG